MENEKLRKITHIIKALADENRIRIVCLLKHKKDLCVCEITDIIGLAQPTISSHLKLLENSGLISSTKNGLWVNYNIREDLDPFSGMIGDALFGELKGEARISSDIRKIKSIDRKEICRKKD